MSFGDCHAAPEPELRNLADVDKVAHTVECDSSADHTGIALWFDTEPTVQRVPGRIKCDGDFHRTSNRLQGFQAP